MKKKLSIFTYITIIYFLIISSNIDIFALSVNEIKNRDACNTLAYELALANIDGNLDTKSCYATYEEAKTNMNSLPEDNLVILERKNDITSIIDAKYAFIDYDQKVNKTTNIYKSLTGTKAFTYIAGGSSDDAPLLSFDYASRRIKIKVSGITGWIDKYDSSGTNQYDIIPLNWVKSNAYYNVTDENITHVIVGNLFNTGKISSVSFGPKPSMLEKGKYYSYDGKYFYNDLKLMLDDYKNDNYNNAVNKDNPYYNYYLYLSHRSKTNYTKEDIDDYITNILGYKSKVSGTLTSTSSMLFNEGNAFYTAQELYGVNSLLIFGVARNESGNGRSNLSINKNNLFGHSAVDSDPYASGDSYIDVAHGIYAHAYKWLSYGYLQPGDYSGRFNSANLGNKNIGLNVKYASDPYWGEKAAGNYYNFDKTYGMQDYNYYRLAVLNTQATIYPKKTPDEKGNNVSSSYYNLNLVDTVILIVDEVETNGEKWYKIMSDPMLDKNLDYTGSSKSDPRVTYNWDSNYVYVPAKYFTVINDVKAKNPNDINYGTVQPETPTLPDNSKPPEVQPEPTPAPEKPNLPSTENPSKDLEHRDNNLYYFEKMNYNNILLEISGFMAITGMDNKKTDEISHRLIVKDDNSDTEYVYNLERWNDGYPFEMTNSDEAKTYDYSGGWFKGNIDFSNLPQGDYKLYIEVSNGKFKSRTNFNNLFFKDMVRKVTLPNKKGILFSMNYLDKSVPMEIQVRDEGLISTNIPPTIDAMYNSFETLEFSGNKLHIKGASHNVGVDYSNNVDVKRTIILENTSNYKRYNFDASSITNGPYEITLRASDGKNKTRAWYDTNIDLTNIPSGTYAIYVKTSGNGGEDYGELSDLLYTTINQTTTINGKKTYLRRVDEKRFRIELVIE